jgi:RNA recognition motif-containing protein
MWRRSSNHQFGGFGGYEGTWISLSELEKNRCRTVWMSPIPPKTSRNQILNFFQEFDAIDCAIHEKNGNCFSFIAFATEQDRDEAIASKRNSVFRGIEVVVNRSFNAFKGPRLGGQSPYDEELERVINY